MTLLLHNILKPSNHGADWGVESLPSPFIFRVEQKMYGFNDVVWFMSFMILRSEAKDFF